MVELDGIKSQEGAEFMVGDGLGGELGNKIAFSSDKDIQVDRSKLRNEFMRLKLSFYNNFIEDFNVINSP